MSKIIGLTGGIGSGKTMVANYIQSLGIPVYISDDEARGLMNTNDVIKAVSDEFGKGIIENGKINREKLAKLVFNNPDKLQKLNRIVHPRVKEHFAAWVINHEQYPIVFKEAAILFESGSYKDCDAVVTITAPLDVRIQRVMERDKTDRESILTRIKNQWTDQQRAAKSNYVIHNVSVENTKSQIDKILNLLINQ